MKILISLKLLGPWATAVITTKSSVVGACGLWLTSTITFIVERFGWPPGCTGVTGCVPFCTGPTCATVNDLVPVDGLATEAVESNAKAKYVCVPAAYLASKEHMKSVQRFASVPSTYISTRSAFALATAVIVTVSSVVGLCGVCDVVSEILALVVVVILLGVGWVGCPGAAGTVNDFAPLSGSVVTDCWLDARA